MDSQKLPPDFVFLPDMYSDPYFPNEQVDMVKAALQKLVAFLEKGPVSTAKIQKKLDQMTQTINGLQDEFTDNESEIETGAREDIADTLERILTYFNVDIDIEEAIRERDW
jgi:hypothetical protein